MRSIALAAKTFDILGDIVFMHPGGDSALRNKSRRATRIATLDGGAVLSDLGYTDGDRDMSIVINPVSEAQATVIEQLVRYHAEIFVTMDDGCYLASLASVRYVGGRATLTVRLIERASE